MNKSNLVEIFYFVDEFCKEFKNNESGLIITASVDKKQGIGHLRCPIVK